MSKEILDNGGQWSRQLQTCSLRSLGGNVSRKRAGLLANQLKLCLELKSARKIMKSKENGEKITPQRSYMIKAQETVADGLVQNQEEASRKRECERLEVMCVYLCIYEDVYFEVYNAK